MIFKTLRIVRMINDPNVQWTAKLSYKVAGKDEIQAINSPSEVGQKVVHIISGICIPSTIWMTFWKYSLQKKYRSNLILLIKTRSKMLKTQLQKEMKKIFQTSKLNLRWANLHPTNNRSKHNIIVYDMDDG